MISSKNCCLLVRFLNLNQVQHTECCTGTRRNKATQSPEMKTALLVCTSEAPVLLQSVSNLGDAGHFCPSDLVHTSPSCFALGQVIMYSPLWAVLALLGMRLWYCEPPTSWGWEASFLESALFSFSTTSSIAWSATGFYSGNNIQLCIS